MIEVVPSLLSIHTLLGYYWELGMGVPSARFPSRHLRSRQEGQVGSQKRPEFDLVTSECQQ